MTTRFFTPPAPRVIAHRGLATSAPENTLLAFQRAVDLGVTHLETDVHATRDGQAVISHDPDLRRLTGRPEQVSAHTMSDLRRLDLGSGQSFCSLAEMLDAFPAARVNIDVKVPEAVGPTVAAVAAAGAADRVLIASFGGRRRRAAVRQLPGAATSPSAGGVLGAVIGATLRARPIVRLALRGTGAIQLPERVIGLAATLPRLVREYHSAGVEVHVWTINDPAGMARLLDAGVDGLVTDRADLALLEVARLR